MSFVWVENVIRQIKCEQCGWLDDAHSETCENGMDGFRCGACRCPIRFLTWLFDGRCKSCYAWGK